MQVPKDQGLFFSVFVIGCVTVVLAGWLALPVHQTTELEGEEPEEEAPELIALEPAVTPEERIKQMERIIGIASATVAQVEETASQKGPSP